MIKIVSILFLTFNFLSAQQNPNFNVSLQLDFQSVESLIDLGEGKFAGVQRTAELRGNQIAARTSALLGRREYHPEDFIRSLEQFRSGVTPSQDLFGLNSTLTNFQQIKILLTEIKKRQLERKVIATIESFFPANTRINTVIPVYFVALGNENAAAFVRRIVWRGSIPQFVGGDEGELTIVVNLARSVQYIQQVQFQFVDMMSTLAHETFHAAFGVYQNTSSVWNEIHRHPEPYWSLAELVQNEGIAYLISLQQHSGAALSEKQLAGAQRAIETLNTVLKELQSPDLTVQRARELIMNSNLSGSYEKNYGATAGMLMAYAVDSKLGRKALTETIEYGVGDFFKKYQELTRQFGELPKFNDEIIRKITE